MSQKEKHRRAERHRKIKKIKENKTIKFWNDRLSKTSEQMRMGGFVMFMDYLQNTDTKFKDYTPDQLVDYQREAVSYARYDILDQVQGWARSLEKSTQPDGAPKYRSSSINSAYSTIRGFFGHNRCELPRDRGFTLSGEIPPVEGDLTTEEIKEVVLSCKTGYKAIFLSIFQSGMDQESFIFWNENGYEALVKALKDNPKAIRITFPRRDKIKRKIEKPFHTYIGTDAIDAIRKWLEKRPDEVTAIFTSQTKNPINKESLALAWIYRLFKLGIIKKKRAGYSGNRYGKNVHELRDVFRSIWEKTPANKNVADFMMGHTIDPLDYNKACRDMDWTESEYLKALPWLNIMSGGAEMKRVEDELNEKDARIEELEAEVARLRESPIDKEAFMEEILEKLAEREKQKKG